MKKPMTDFYRGITIYLTILCLLLLTSLSYGANETPSQKPESSFSSRAGSGEVVSSPRGSATTTKASTATFREKFLYPLKWGISVDLFKSTYPRATKLVESMPGYYQDLFLPFYGQTAIAGFRFGEKGLDLIAISYYFETKGKRLYQKDVLIISKRILQKIKQAYGEHLVSSPWDGTMFMHVWLINGTLIQFAWDGGDSWGVHFRSIELDPWARAYTNQMKKALGK